jgi:hypothetical protein
MKDALRAQFAPEGVTKDQDQQYEVDGQRSVLKGYAIAIFFPLTK